MNVTTHVSLAASGTASLSADGAVFEAINRELKRQQDQIELIASENIVSNAVLAAQGSVLTNKYAEGYPGRRYYGGCEYVDVIEQISIDRCVYRKLNPNVLMMKSTQDSERT